MKYIYLLIALISLSACSGGNSSLPSLGGVGGNQSIEQGAMGAPAFSVSSKSIARRNVKACTGMYIQIVLCEQAQGPMPTTNDIYYQMAGNTITDSSGNSHTATMNPTIIAKNPFIPDALTSAHSMNFANGYATDTAVQTVPAMSVVAWVRPTQSDLSNSGRIISNGWTDSDAAGYELWFNGGVPGFQVGWVDASASGVILGAKFPLNKKNMPALVAGKSYQLVGTYDGTTEIFYLNGYPLSYYTWTNSNPQPQLGDPRYPTQNVTYIGALYANCGSGCGPGITSHFSGDISHVQTYNYALSLAQVDENYNAGSGANVQATPIPSPTPTAAPTAYPTPMPLGTPVVDNGSGNMCIFNKKYIANRNADGLPATSAAPNGVGELASAFDMNWWGRTRGNTIGGNTYTGYGESWGHFAGGYDTRLADPRPGSGDTDPLDGGSNPLHNADIPYIYGPDPVDGINSVAILAHNMPSYMVGTSWANPPGNPSGGSLDYISGILDTPINQQYGYYEWNIKTPTPANGLSPAAWMLTNNNVPYPGEWDVQEMFGPDEGNGMNSGTIWWSSANYGGTFNWDNNPVNVPGNTNLGGIQESTLPSTGYHRWGILLLPGGATLPTPGQGTHSPGSGYVFNPPSIGGSIVFLDGYPLYGHVGGGDLTQGVAWKELFTVFQTAKSGWFGGANINDSNPPAYFVRDIRAYVPTGTSCS